MDSHSFMLIHGWWLWGIVGGAHDESICFSFLQMLGINSISYLISISTIMSCMDPCSCRGVHSNNTHISSKHTYSHIWWDHRNPSLFSLTCWGWFSPFCWWFPSWEKGYFRLKGICLCFGSIITSFFQWPFRYGVWTFMRLFFPKWLCEWFWPFFKSMWAYCLRSCSTFNIVFVFCILTLNIKEIVWMHTSHYDWWSDLLLSCSHFGYSI